MRILKTVVVVLALSVLPLHAADQQNDALDQVVDRIISQEQAEMNSLKPYSPLVETYIQNLKGDKDLGAVPAGDKYFMGRAVLSKGVELEPLTDGSDNARASRRKSSAASGSMFSLSMEYLPRGFLQMIYIDTNGFDKEHYKFDYVRREFLGEVRTLVFDVTPLPKAGKGRFMGRIWVEDQDFHIVRFNGAYGGSSRTNYYFHFDSWRVNSGPNLWLPAFIYSEESDLNFAAGEAALLQGADAAVGIQPRPFRAGAGTQQDPDRVADSGEGPDHHGERLQPRDGATQLGPPGGG